MAVLIDYTPSGGDILSNEEAVFAGSSDVVFTGGGQVDSSIVVEWDFDNDGDFSETVEDITSYVLSLETVTGRDWPSLLTGKASPGALRMTLNNNDDRFSYFNTASPLVTSPYSLRTGRKIRVRTAESTPSDPVLYARDRFQGEPGGLGGEEIHEYTWTQAFTDKFSVIGGNAVASSPGDTNLAVVDVGQTAYYAQVRIITAGLSSNVVGLCYRYQDSNNYSLCVLNVADGQVHLIDVVAGTPTTLSSHDTEVYDRMTLGVKVTGSSVTAYREGVQILTGTAIQTDETEVGIYAEYGADDEQPALNNFYVWSDLASEVEGILWTGEISDLTASVSSGPVKTATVTAEGRLTKLAAQTITPPHTIEGRPTGYLVGQILAEAENLHPPLPLDNGDITTGPFGLGDMAALEAARRMEDTELGFLYETQDGWLAYKERSARSTATSQVTFSDLAGAQYGYHAIEPFNWQKEIFNRVTAGVASQVPSNPTRYERTQSQFDSTHDLKFAMPATGPGDLLIVGISAQARAVATITENWVIPAGWAEISGKPAQGYDVGGPYDDSRVYVRVCDGSESSKTITFATTEATDANGTGAAQIYHFTDWFGTSEGVGIGEFSIGNSNPGAIFPSWGLNPSVFIAFRFGIDATTGLTISGTTYPLGYTNGLSTSILAGDSLHGSAIQSAWKKGVATLEDPQAFGGTFQGFAQVDTVVVAVRGAVTDATSTGDSFTPIQVDDIDSQTDHNAIRTYEYTSNLFATSAAAETYANLVLSTYADDRPILSISFYAVRSNSYRAQAYRRRIGEKITLVANNNSGMGISQDFFIEAISHRFSSGTKLWETTWQLSPA